MYHLGALTFGVSPWESAFSRPASDARHQTSARDQRHVPEDPRGTSAYQILPCCVLVNTKRTLISPQPFVAWQTKRRRGLRPSARVGVVRAHRGSMPA